MFDESIATLAPHHPHYFREFQHWFWSRRLPIWVTSSDAMDPRTNLCFGIEGMVFNGPEPSLFIKTDAYNVGATIGFSHRGECTNIRIESTPVVYRKIAEAVFGPALFGWGALYSEASSDALAQGLAAVFRLGEEQHAHVLNQINTHDQNVYVSRR